MKKVILINPPYSSKVFPIPVILPGLGYLAETLRSNGIDVYIIDAQLGWKLKKIAEKIQNIKPDFIGFSFMSYMSSSHSKLVKDIKDISKNSILVAGGPHVSSLREQVLIDIPALDYGIVLDGEQSLLDLVQGKPKVDIPGLIYRNSNSDMIVNSACLENDLDKIQWPKYEDFELARYGYGICIVTSRGCPYNCIYCSCNVIGKKYNSDITFTILIFMVVGAMLNIPIGSYCIEII